MIVHGITGVVTEDSWDDSDLIVKFDNAVKIENALILAVPLSKKWQRTKLILPGDKVTCDFKPARPGHSSKLVRINRL